MPMRLLRPALAALALMLAFPGIGLAQIRVITSGGFAAPLKAALPAFEKSSGLTVTVMQGKSQGAGPDTIAAQLDRGVAADLVILSREGLNDLIAKKKVAASSAIDLARTPLGVAVRAGAPRPDISTVEAFRAALLRARAITYPSSTTGIWMTTKLFPQLGIADQMAAKSSNANVAAVVAGDAELAIQPVSELLHVPGADFVGTLPAAIQYVSVFAAAATAADNSQARQLIDYLASPAAAPAMRDAGMEPLGRP